MATSSKSQGKANSTTATTTTTTNTTVPFLSSLYIYNPSLGQTDNTVHEQLIFHYSLTTTKNVSSKSVPADSSPNDSQELHKQLRAIGLAQGIVQFARAFSPNSPVQEVRTHKGFTVPLEVEKGWWMLATVESPTPSPVDLITPSLLCALLRRVYRLQRLQYRTFKFLLNSHSLEFLRTTVEKHYDTFARDIDLSLTGAGVEMAFDGLRWSCQPLDQHARESLLTWVQETKGTNGGIIDAFLFRDKQPYLPYEATRDGLLFPGLQDGNLSMENIRDISLLISTLDTKEVEEKVDPNGAVSGKRSVSLPGLSQSWDSVVQTSSSLFSALSFGTVPAKRSPLATIEEPVMQEPVKKKEEGRWIMEGSRVWLEAGQESLVPISLGNQRPGFLREHSTLPSPGEDDLVEVELFIYKFNDLLLTFVMLPNSKPPSNFLPVLQDIASPTTQPRPPTPQSLKPFVLIHDPVTHLLHSTIPPIPKPTPPPPQSFSLTPKRNQKRDPYPREQALEIHSHILRLREQYDRISHGRRVREFTAKTPHYFIYRTLVTTEERRMAEFAEGWYVVRTGVVGQAGGTGGMSSGLGRGDNAGGLESIAKVGREVCRDVWRGMNVLNSDSDDE